MYEEGLDGFDFSNGFAINVVDMFAEYEGSV